MLDILGHSSDFSHDDAVRLRRLEQKVDLILKHLGIDYVETSNLSEEARAQADRGDKIGAIKVHRQNTGVGLAEAKYDIEAYLARGR
jgi:ribosomal protein L7/L12